MKFCIIGAGNGGRAFATYLSAHGHPVTLYNRSYTRIAAIKKKGGIKSTGEIKGFFKINRITQKLDYAVKDADVILVVTPASAHKYIAQEIAPFLTKDQIILLNPGRTFGAIEFLKTIQEQIGSFPVFIAETQTLLFTSRQLNKNGVQILKIKNKVLFSAYPEKYTFFVYDTLKEIFPQLHPAEDYLKMTLTNIGMLLHPTLSVLNSGMIDIGKKFKFYSEGATKRTCMVLEQLEFEINEICQKLRLKRYNFCKWVKNSYGVKGNCIYDSIRNIEAYKDIDSPNQLNTRYFTEDVPTGLVPLKSIGDILKINTPVIDSIITLSSIIMGIDFEKQGRTVENLDLVEYILNKSKIEISIENISEKQKTKASLF
jgi:opine dehydrogenase